MASISTGKDGRRCLVFAAPDGTRKKIYLGKLRMGDAETIKGHVEQLVTAIKHNTVPHKKTAEWLAQLGDDLAGKLARAGLIRSRPCATSALGEYVRQYREQRTDVAKATNTIFGIVGNRLTAFFTAERQLDTITEGDADRWLVWLKTEGYAGPTISKSINVARQFWAQAMRDGLAAVNPFAHLKRPSEVNTARYHFVDRPTFARVLEACPDDQWRLLLALARYGGLRCPSEPLGLEWSDVNWERKRFRVVAPKTKHESGGERWVPLFPELAEILERVWDAAHDPDGAAPTGPVITRWRDSKLNLRTGLLRILRRAGVKQWPRLLQNLRASRDTELAGQFPMHVAAEWLGHSPKTALAHYLRTTEEDFAAATVQAPSAEPAIEPATGAAGRKTGRATARLTRPDTPPEGTETDDGVPGRELARPVASSQNDLMAEVGLETSPQVPRFSHVAGSTGRKTGRAAPDPRADAERLLPVLETLTGELRAAFLAALQPDVRTRLLDLAAQQRAETAP